MRLQERARCPRRHALGERRGRCKASASHISSATMLPSLLPRPREAGITVGDIREQGAREPETSVGAAARVSVGQEDRDGFEQTSNWARWEGRGWRCPAAARPPARRRRIKTSLDWRPARARGTVSRASSGSRGERSLAALRSRRPGFASAPLLGRDWPRNRSTRARPETRRAGQASTHAAQHREQSTERRHRVGRRRPEQSLRSVRGRGVSAGGAPEEGQATAAGPPREPAPVQRNAGAMQGPVLVGIGRRLRPGPSAAIRVDLGSGRFRQGDGQRRALSARLPSTAERTSGCGRHTRTQAPAGPSASTVPRSALGRSRAPGRTPYDGRRRTGGSVAAMRIGDAHTGA